MRSLRIAVAVARQRGRGPVRSTACTLTRRTAVSQVRLVRGSTGQQRYYAKQALVAESDRNNATDVEGPVDSYLKYQLERVQDLVGRIEDVVRNDMGGRDAWVRRLHRVIEDLDVPRKKRIGGM